MKVDPPVLFGRRMRLKSKTGRGHRVRLTFRLGGSTVYNWHDRRDWMAAHDTGVWVPPSKRRPTPQHAARALERAMASAHRKLGKILDSARR